jgi:hypothetical protein
LAFLFQDFVSKFFFSFPYFPLNRPPLESNRERDGSSHFGSSCKVLLLNDCLDFLKHIVYWRSFTI